MSAERFFDDLARTLAEPMPRRRAVRVIGASLVAIAAPGFSPRLASAATAWPRTPFSPTTPRRAATCAAGDIVCKYDGNLCCPGGPRGRPACCPTKSPLSGFHGCCKTEAHCCCGNTCCDPVTQRCVCPAPGGRGGVCAPKCKLLDPFSFDCGITCCKSYERCVNGECKPCDTQSCQPYKSGRTICCPKGTKCCANNTSTACCGPNQVCKAQGVKTAKCDCKPGTGTKCGSDCCGKSEYCCGGLGTERCCKKGEDCCNGECCTGGSICCDLECCDPKRGEFCLAKIVPGADTTLTCKKSCNQANKCGPYCCGTGTRCVKGKCVPA